MSLLGERSGEGDSHRPESGPRPSPSGRPSLSLPRDAGSQLGKGVPRAPRRGRCLRGRSSLLVNLHWFTDWGADYSLFNLSHVLSPAARALPPDLFNHSLASPFEVNSD